MDSKSKYIIYSVFDWLLSLGGSISVILINYISKDNSIGFKIGFGGIVLFVITVFVCKGMYEKSYQDKMNMYLGQLASESDLEIKNEIKSKISKLEQANNIYSRVLMLLPFMILYFATSLGAESMESLKATCGFVILSLGSGSVFNVLKQPLKKEVSRDNIIKKVNKKAK